VSDKYGNPQMNVRVPFSTLHELDRLADDLGAPRSVLVRDALNSYISAVKVQQQEPVT